ncbi:MAG: helix-hairpin-helix domain-containing protein [Anaerolineales bacterium]
MTLLLTKAGGPPNLIWIFIAAIVVVLLVAWLLGRNALAAEATAAPESKAVAAAPAPVPETVAAAAPDDLQRIEGIGPKLSSVLQAAGITTFGALAAKTGEELQAVLDAAGVARISDPTTWPEQAALAAAGRWDELEAMQASLKRGRKVL